MQELQWGNDTKKSLAAFHRGVLDERFDRRRLLLFILLGAGTYLLHHRNLSHGVGDVGEGILV
jgi:hypothetical protein